MLYREAVADRFAKCTVLFAKLIDVGRQEIKRSFSRIDQPSGDPAGHDQMDPIEVFNTLNELVSIFDNRISLFGLEKIKTIGQSYMVQILIYF